MNLINEIIRYIGSTVVTYWFNDLTAVKAGKLKRIIDFV